MFKKTEETEWTRFSKALSSRDREEGEASGEPEASQESAVGSSSGGRADSQAMSSVLRQSTSDVNVSSRAANRAASAPVEDDIESTIGEHTTVEGTFRSENSIRVRGVVQGEIESRKSVLIEAEASVTAKVTGEAVTVAGQVNGQIYCQGRVEIKPTGRVTGEIHAGTLIMQEGAFLEGNLKMGNVATASDLPEPIAAQS